MEDKNFISKRSVDIVFLVDTSGSMSDEIEAVKSSCQNFADKIIKKSRDVRLGLVGFSFPYRPGEYYKRNDDKPNYQTHYLSKYTIGVWRLKTPIEFKKNIQTLTLGMFGGCGCHIANQDTVDLFPHIADVFAKQSNNAKILVIISDEIGSNAGLSQITNLLITEKIVTYVMGVPKPKGAHQMIAQATGGDFWDITKTKGTQDFSKLLGNVAEKIVRDLTARSNNEPTNEKRMDVERQKNVSDNTILADSIISKFDKTNNSQKVPKSITDISSTIDKF